MKVVASIVNAFTSEANGGNPAGVVLNSPKLTDKQMTRVTKILKVSETAFVFPGKTSDYKVRFFSPILEVDLCGHATIATFFYMVKDGHIICNKNKILTQETKAGILPISIEVNGEGIVERVMMKQASPELKDIHLDIRDLSSALNIKIESIDRNLPQQIVSTGLFTLPVCIKSFQFLKDIKPDFEKVKTLCKKLDIGSIHCFTFETVEPISVYNARNFAPVYGVNEDPVTGTANGAVVSYLLKNNIISDDKVICEQGDIIGRPGRVFVEVKDNNVMVGGKAFKFDDKLIDV
ncbi:MAG: PhzF family phenazine biosynthesis protein [Candidatus Thermoplasmatota archaeon]|nr:PhzF family phenazine biosynthesis protein [Candidatus Thermoplasmatota archaeon]